MPSPVSAEQVTTRGLQPSGGVMKRCSALSYSIAGTVGLGTVIAIGLVDGDAVGQLR